MNISKEFFTCLIQDFGTELDSIKTHNKVNNMKVNYIKNNHYQLKIVMNPVSVDKDGWFYNYTLEEIKKYKYDVHIIDNICIFTLVK